MTVPAVHVDVRLTDHLVVMTTEVPDGTSDAEVADMRKREAVRAGELARPGELSGQPLDLHAAVGWRIPDPQR